MLRGWRCMRVSTGQSYTSVNRSPTILHKFWQPWSTGVICKSNNFANFLWNFPILKLITMKMLGNGKNCTFVPIDWSDCNYKVSWQVLGSTKVAITKEFFSSVERRLVVNLTLNPKVKTIMTGHGNIRSYLHRLKVIGSPECPCKHGTQTVDHLIFQCNRLKAVREDQCTVLRVGNWPVNKSELTHRYLKQFTRYVNSMDLEKLNHSNKQM
jgi:hypothetical protein